MSPGGPHPHTRARIGSPQCVSHLRLRTGSGEGGQHQSSTLRAESGRRDVLDPEMLCADSGRFQELVTKPLLRRGRELQASATDLEALR
eukprot:330102-Alexandrium_andersonii.AAC.1